MGLHYPRLLAFPSLRRRLSRLGMRLLFGAPGGGPATPLPRHGIHRILICHVSHTLGNTVLATPLLQDIERVWPGAEVDIVSRSPVAPQVYGAYPGVSRLIVLPAYGFAHPLTVWRCWRRMRAARYDLAIDTDPRSQTGRLWLLRARARCTLGYDGPRKSGRLSHPVPVEGMPRRKAWQPVHLLRRALGETDSSRPWPLPDLRLSADERACGRAMLVRIDGIDAGSEDGPAVIGLFANATGNKRLEQAWWRTLLERLPAGTSAKPPVEIVPAFGRSLLDDRYPAFFCTDLRKLAATLSALDVLVTGDCGVMHLACAAGVPVIALFVATDADEWGPYGPHDHVLAVRRDAPERAAAAISQLLANADAPASRQVLRPRPVDAAPAWRPAALGA